MGLLRYSELTTAGEYLLKNGEREYGAPVTFIGGEVCSKFLHIFTTCLVSMIIC